MCKIHFIAKYVMYNVLNDRHNSCHVTMKTDIVLKIYYLDGCRFTVNNVLVLSNCDNDSIDTWKIRSILFRILLFLKLARHFSNVRK